ncbi:MAG TPA: undecaprenyl-diphosphatase [Marinospirillum sp.]|uniref:undecaprenyl-diphosphatase n=1 Tax=Marinospirillum sp. TaxID=2183934 RepID=UPI002B47125A|nr:undecaprenyl-diphosphatase [Marinospirillum sp.]HKM16530.1 undecaprenyl-diphosphatase [Marinospirillum sp.]
MIADLNSTFFLLINQYAGKNTIVDVLVIFMAEAMPFLLIALMLLLWFFGSFEKKRISFFAGYSVLLALFISYLIGLVYFHPRPFVAHLGTQLVEHTADASFPSDHTTFIFAIAFMYVFNQATRSLGYALCLLSVLAGLARVFVGVHYPLDIVGAALLGGISSLMVIFLVGKLNCLERFYQLFTCIKLPNWLLKN